MKKSILEWVKAIASALALFFILNIFISTTTVYSTSMYPTLIEGDRLVLQRTQNVNRGDIVSFKSDMTLSERDIQSLNFLQKLMVSKKTKKNLIKRVIGLPGEKIDVKDGVVRINDKVIDEPYISTITTDEAHYDPLPENMYFMMGDNRSVSLDSRHIGPVEGDKIIGKTIFRFFPFGRLGTVE